MRRAKTFRSRVCFFLMAALLGFLFGCGLESPEEAELYREDSGWQTLQRLFFADLYWKKKIATLQENVAKSREAFESSTQAYHLLLQKRRERVMQAIAQAQKSGSDTDAARRGAIQSLRGTLDPLREEARQKGKTLRHAMALLVQAEQARRGKNP